MEERELKDPSTIAEARRGGARIDQRILLQVSLLLCSESVSAAALYHSFTAVEVITWIMMAYLIEVGGLDLTHAARVITLCSGSVPLLAIVFLFLATNLTGNFSFVLLGLVANTSGLSIITFAATTTNTTHTFVGLFFLLIGLACREPSHAFVTDLLHHLDHRALIRIGEEGPPRAHNKVETTTTGASFTKMAITFLFFPLCLPCWFCRFVLGAVLMAVITLLVVVATLRTSYRFDRPLLREGTTSAPGGMLPKGFVESGGADRPPYGCPNGASDRGSTYNVCQRLLYKPPPPPTLSICSCCIEEEEEGTSISDDDTRWTAREVTKLLGETKDIPHMVPTCIALLVSGLVSCLGETYFIAQALRSDSKLGSLNLSIYILFAFQRAAEFLFARFLRNQNPTKETILAMLYSTLCCVTAALVETRRVNTPNDDGQSPMSLLWLVPQFVLLGGFKGVFDNSIGKLIQQEVKKDTHIIITSLAKGVQGLGKLGSILLVYVVGKLGETYYRDAYWFKDTSSRLDLYYWVLALFSAFAYVLLFDNLL